MSNRIWALGLLCLYLGVWLYIAILARDSRAQQKALRQGRATRPRL